MDHSILIPVASRAVNLALAGIAFTLRERTADSRKALEEARIREANRRAEVRKRWNGAR